MCEPTKSPTNCWDIWGLKIEHLRPAQLKKLSDSAVLRTSRPKIAFWGSQPPSRLGSDSPRHVKLVAPDEQHLPSKFGLAPLVADFWRITKTCMDFSPMILEAGVANPKFSFCFGMQLQGEQTGEAGTKKSFGNFDFCQWKFEGVLTCAPQSDDGWQHDPGRQHRAAASVSMPIFMLISRAISVKIADHTFYLEAHRLHKGTVP